VDALDSTGNSLNNLTVEGRLLSPELQQTDVTLTQIAPGRYRTEFSPRETGAYLLRLLARDADGQLVSSATRGFVVSYSPEYAANRSEPTLPADLASLGGGKMLAAADAAAVFEHTLPPVRGSRPLWRWLLMAFALLLPLDVGVRRVMFGREHWEKLLNWLRGKLAAPEKTAAPAPVSSPAKSLLSVKKATRLEKPKSPLIIPPKTAGSEAETPPQKTASPNPKRTTNRLLDAKRRAGRGSEK